MKVFERVIEEKIREQVKIDDMKFGFMNGKATIDAIFIARQLQERYVEKKKKFILHLWTWKRLLTECQERL